MNHLARLALAALPLVACQDIHAPDTTSPQRLEITLPRAISPKEQYTLQVTAYTRSGLPLAPPSGIAWSSSDESVATVDANGTVTGLALGYSMITAAAGGMTGYTTILVRPADLRITMTPEVLAVGDTGVVSVARLDYVGDVIANDDRGAWWEWEENNIVEFLPRTPGQPEKQLVVVGRTPGSLFVWVDGFGASKSFWINVVDAVSTR
jgi:hypothetical protein